MDASEEFIVVDEKESAEQETVARLKTLIDLFTKSLDAVNESNILLRDELRSALSVTLQYCPSDGTINTEEIVKALDENVTGVDEVRSKYIRHLCSKLVSVDSELKELRTQNEALKSSLELWEKERAEQLNSFCTTLQTLEKITKRYENFSRFHVEDAKDESGVNSEILENEGTHSANFTSLCTNLASICDRLDKLDFGDPQIINLRPKTLDACVEAHLEPVVLPIDVSTQATYCPAKENVGVSTSTPPVTSCEITDDVPTVPAPPYANEDTLNSPRGESFQSSSGTVATSPLTNPTANNSPIRTRTPEPQAAPEPTFHAHDEEPWCPACSQYFASRTDLEEHLPLCLD